MIFSVGDHIQQIISGEKTQTRRKSNWYKLGMTYSIQPGRTKSGISEGKIMIIEKRIESHRNLSGKVFVISQEDALAEGGYTPEQFEELYSKMYPGWPVRLAYTFKFIPTKEVEG